MSLIDRWRALNPAVRIAAVGAVWGCAAAVSISAVPIGAPAALLLAIWAAVLAATLALNYRREKPK
jgi:hypothetical protein